ncbi:hypothetical protein TKK_0005527 [Trichogramma kaykai]
MAPAGVLSSGVDEAGSADSPEETYDVALKKLKIRVDHSDVEDRYQSQQTKASRHDRHLKKVSTDNDSDEDNLQRHDHSELLKDIEPPSLPLELENNSEKRTS